MMQKSFFLLSLGVVARLAMGTILFLVVVSGVSILGTSGSPVAHAASGAPNFALAPVLYDPSNPLTESYFIFDSKPGTTITSRVRVTNTGTAKGSVALYPVDATTGQTSGAVYLNQADPRKDVGAWLSLTYSQLTLNPNQSQIVTFKLTIPGTIRPGQHLGGIVAENLTQSSTQSNSAIQIKVKNLTIIAVQVDLPGTPVESLTGTGVKAGGQNGYQQLLIGLANTGSVMLKPYGTLQVANSQGQLLKNISLKLDTFLPQTAINYPVAITGQGLASGDYQMTLTMMYGHGQTLHYTTKFTITQQQIATTFGTTSSKTQVPIGQGGSVFGGMPLWQLVLVAGGALAILWLVGNMIFRRLAVSRAGAKQANSYSSQFKRPTF